MRGPLLQIQIMIRQQTVTRAPRRDAEGKPAILIRYIHERNELVIVIGFHSSRDEGRGRGSDLYEGV